MQLGLCSSRNNWDWGVARKMMSLHACSATRAESKEVRGSISFPICLKMEAKRSHKREGGGAKGLDSPTVVIIIIV